ncbi:MAG: 4Fe-4S binding protein [Halococcoides sp.]
MSVGTFLTEALRTFRTDSATIDYPAESRDLPDRFRGKIAFEADPCTGCGMCERHCAADAIVVEGDADEVTWAYDAARCMFCGQCVESCPTGALESTDEYDLADDDSDTLRESHTFSR